MIIGFACSLGIDMGYNSNHHQDIASEQIFDNTIADCHDIPNSGTSDKQSDSSNSKDCCSDSVVKFLKLDKSASPLSNVDVSTPVLALVYRFRFQLELLQHLENTSLKTQLIRSDHPPQQDVRTAIQSFLI